MDPHKIYRKYYIIRGTFSTSFALGQTYSNITYYLGWIVLGGVNQTVHHDTHSPSSWYA